MIIKKTCYLIFSESSKIVKASLKPPTVKPNEVAIRVEINIPHELFHPSHLNVKIDVPFDPLSSEVVADLESAIGAAYGKKIQLVVGPVVE